MEVWQSGRGLFPDTAEQGDMTARCWHTHTVLRHVHACDSVTCGTIGEAWSMHVVVKVTPSTQYCVVCPGDSSGVWCVGSPVVCGVSR